MEKLLHLQCRLKEKGMSRLNIEIILDYSKLCSTTSRIGASITGSQTGTLTPTQSLLPPGGSFGRIKSGSHRRPKSLWMPREVITDLSPNCRLIASLTLLSWLKMAMSNRTDYTSASSRLSIPLNLQFWLMWPMWTSMKTCSRSQHPLLVNLRHLCTRVLNKP